MKEAVRYLEKTEFIECMENLGLGRVPNIAIVFGKSEQSVYKYMNIANTTEIPNVVVQHLITIALIADGDRQRSIIEAALVNPLPSDIDGVKVYGDILKAHNVRPNKENIAEMFGKSSATIYRANMRGGAKHDSALAAHLRTLRLLTKDELAAVIARKFEEADA